MRAFKAVVYPIAGVVQFYLATQHTRLAVPLVILGLALIGLGVLNLHKLTKRD